MENRYLFSVKTEHDIIRLPHFGPFLTATEAGQAVDRLLARFDGLSLQIHAFKDPQIASEELEQKHRICIEQIEASCSLGAPVYVVEPLHRVDELPNPEEAVQVAADNGFDPSDLGYLRAGQGYVLARLHMSTPDAQKALTAARWRRRELAGTSRASDVLVMTMPICALPR